MIKSQKPYAWQRSSLQGLQISWGFPNRGRNGQRRQVTNSESSFVGCSKARVRLASMAPGLKDFTRTLTPDKAWPHGPWGCCSGSAWAWLVDLWEATFAIGQDPTCALKVKGPLVSRSHAVVSWHRNSSNFFPLLKLKKYDLKIWYLSHLRWNFNQRKVQCTLACQ